MTILKLFDRIRTDKDNYYYKILKTVIKKVNGTNVQ